MAIVFIIFSDAREREKNESIGRRKMQPVRIDIGEEDLSARKF